MVTDQGCIGSCSHCGGEVMGYTGVWMSVAPPPPARCRQCGSEFKFASGPVWTATPIPSDQVLTARGTVEPRDQ